MEFDLSHLVREVHDTTDWTDHQQVAKEVRSRIPDEHVEDAFLIALTEFVRVRFTTFRTSVAPVKPNKSAKVRGIRQWWQRNQNQRYDSADGEQKLLRDFTAEDCLFQAALLRDKAAQNIAKAEQWESLAKMLGNGGTVRDLAAAA